MNRTRFERETTIRFDEDTKKATLWTASPAISRKWAKFGYPIQVQTNSAKAITEWRVDNAPLRVVSFRRWAKAVRKPCCTAGTAEGSLLGRGLGALAQERVGKEGTA